jgi:hypothetical protein
MSTFPDKVVEAKRPSVIDGAVPKTREPDPVSSVMSAASFAEVSKEVDDTLSLNTFQSEDARKPLVAPLAWVMVRVLPKNESGPEKDVALIDPFALVPKRPFVMPVMARALVVPCPPAKVRFEAKRLVVDAVVAKRFVVVAAVMVALVPKMLAIVPEVAAKTPAKNDVEVALVVVAFCAVTF